jgi:hypothetical protein
MNPDGTILEAGDYFVELAFTRVCEPDVLRRALEAMGWSNIVFDETPPPTTGAVPMKTTATSAVKVAARPATITRTVSSAPQVKAVATVTAPVTAPAPTVSVPRAPLSLASKTVSRSAIVSQLAAQAAKDNFVVERMAPRAKPPGQAAAPAAPSPPGGGAPSAGPKPGLSCENIDKLDQAAWDALTPADQNFYMSCVKSTMAEEQGGPGAMPGGGGGGGEAPSSPEEPSPEPEPEPMPEPMPGQDAEGPSLAQTTAADPMKVLVESLKALTPGQAPPSEPLPNETADIKNLRLQNLWRRWVEWGSPFATAPGGSIDEAALAKTRIAGEDEEDPTRIRFIGRLQNRIRLVNPPGMWWVFVKPLDITFDDGVRLNVEPHALEPGGFYEFRLLVRDKTAPNRAEVKARLGAMGFAPMKLHLLKRNIRLPNRPSSLSMWYGMGQWLHPSTVVTVEDPFYFEQVKEVSP